MSEELKTTNKENQNANPSPHSHEEAGAIGMAIGGFAGGLLGSLAGPVGLVAGATIGGGAGGEAGEIMAREANPTAEELHWEQNYHTRPYVKKEHDFETYRPAYRVGIDGFFNNPAVSFDDLEPSIRNNWNISRGGSNLEWSDARDAARDAFDRLAKLKHL